MVLKKAMTFEGGISATAAAATIDANDEAAIKSTSSRRSHADTAPS